MTDTWVCVQVLFYFYVASSNMQQVFDYFVSAALCFQDVHYVEHHAYFVLYICYKINNVISQIA